MLFKARQAEKGSSCKFGINNRGFPYVHNVEGSILGIWILSNMMYIVDQTLEYMSV